MRARKHRMRTLRARMAAMDRLLATGKAGQTYWNGEPCVARRVLVRVGRSPVSTWWCAKLEGTEREAVEVRYGRETFYLDDADGSGWSKVTEGRGSPWCYHASLPVDTVLRTLEAPEVVA